MDVKFSVLLSVYKKENPFFLKQSIGSLLNQTLLPNEIVLVKDGVLTEELDKLINEYIQNYDIFKVIVLETNVGLGNALNIGLKYCSYDIVARMDTDDIAKQERFERQIEIFLKKSYLDVVGAWVDEFEDNISNVSSTRKLPELQKDIYEFAKSRNPMNHPVIMFRKSVITDVGGYQHFPFFEDYYLWVRLLMHGAKFYNIQESLLYFRFSPDMFRRRGGWEYVTNESRFQNIIRKTGFITSWQFLKNMTIRFIARIIPNSLRAALYKKILRK